MIWAMALQDQVSDNVRVLSAAKRTTPTAVARSLGRSPQWIQAKLAGRNRWTIEDVEAIGGELEVSPTVLMSTAWWPEELLRACRDSNPKPSDLYPMAA
jgi:hypothetical protein